MQYKEKKQSGSVSLPRKSVLKSSVTSARLPPAKAKADPVPKAESGRRSLTSEMANAPSSIKLGPTKSATAKVAVSSRKK